MQRLLSKSDAEDLQAKIAAMRERHKRAEADRKRQEESERAAYAGTCYDCRDSGIEGGTLNHPCPHCSRGRSLAAERHMAAARAILDEAHLPPRCRSFTLDTYPAQELAAYGKLLDFLREWDGHQGLILKGPYGTGKTGLLAGALRAVCDLYAGSGRRVAFTTGADLLDELRRGYDDGTHATRLQRAKTVALLAIDDLGAEKPSEWVIERLFVIINHRYEYELPTFLTTNYGLEELAERIGPRVLERLLETCRVVPVEGRNLRERK